MSAESALVDSASCRDHNGQRSAAQRSQTESEQAMSNSNSKSRVVISEAQRSHSERDTVEQIAAALMVGERLGHSVEPLSTGEREDLARRIAALEQISAPTRSDEWELEQCRRRYFATAPTSAADGLSVLDIDLICSELTAADIAPIWQPRLAAVIDRLRARQDQLRAADIAARWVERADDSEQS